MIYAPLFWTLLQSDRGTTSETATGIKVIQITWSGCSAFWGGHLECGVAAAEEKGGKILLSSFSLLLTVLLLPLIWACHAQQTSSSTTGRKLAWGLEGRGCFGDGWVKQLTGKVKVWQKGNGEMCFDLTVHGSTAKENPAEQCLSNERILCERCRDALVCTDNVMLKASNPMFYFCKDTFCTTGCNEEKCFSTLKVSGFSSFKKMKQAFSKLLKVNGKTLIQSWSIIQVWAKKQGHLSQ